MGGMLLFFEVDDFVASFEAWMFCKIHLIVVCKKNNDRA